MRNAVDTLEPEEKAREVKIGGILSFVCVIIDGV
jgi:hypothetical protein